jgi:hypothetical protein
MVIGIYERQHDLWNEESVYDSDSDVLEKKFTFFDVFCGFIRISVHKMTVQVW